MSGALGEGHPVGDVILDDVVIAKRVDEIASELIEIYEGQDPLYVGVLMGGGPFAIDLMRSMVRRRAHLNPRFEFIRAETYTQGKNAGQTEITFPLKRGLDLSGIPAVVIDDLCDKNKTLPAVHDYLRKEHDATDIKSVVLMDKPDAKKEPGPLPDIVGFEIPNRWIHGYGPDAGQDDHPDAYRYLGYVSAID